MRVLLQFKDLDERLRRQRPGRAINFVQRGAIWAQGCVYTPEPHFLRFRAWNVLGLDHFAGMDKNRPTFLTNPRRPTWKLTERLCKWNSVFQRGHFRSFHVSLPANQHPPASNGFFSRRKKSPSGVAAWQLSKPQPCFSHTAGQDMADTSRPAGCSPGQRNERSPTYHRANR